MLTLSAKHVERGALSVPRRPHPVSSQPLAHGLVAGQGTLNAQRQTLNAIERRPQADAHGFGTCSVLLIIKLPESTNSSTARCRRRPSTLTGYN